MHKSKKVEKRRVLDKMLILLALICIIIATLMISIYVDNAETQVFAKNANKIKKSYTSETNNGWNISATEGDNVTATLAEDGTLTISGTGKMKDYDYDSEPEYFEMKDNIRAVVIQDGVTNIGDSAFSDCVTITSVVIPNSVTSIGSNAFQGCESLKNITIPDGVETISYGVFHNCTNLEMIDISKSVTSIENGTFSGTTSLQKIEVAEENTTYKDDNGILYTKESSVTPSKLVQYPSGKEGTSYTILSGVTIIGSNAFSDCDNLTNIVIPEGVTDIEDGAFEFCTKLSSIEIPNTVQRIEGFAFSGCDNLTNITISNSVTEIGSGVFSSCEKLQNIEVAEGNTTYKDENGVLYTKDGTRIIQYPTGKADTSYTILSGVTTIGENAFSNCQNLTTITIPNTVTDMEYGAFEFCSKLQNIVIPNTVTSIGYGVFYGCASLVNINIPESVTSIEDKFAFCEKLQNIEVAEGNTQYKDDNGVLYTKDGTELIKYPEAKTNTSYTILSGVTTIGDSAFSNCNNLTSIVFPDSVTEIGYGAFQYCTKLASIEIPNKVTSIEYSMFIGCESLTNINIPDSVTNIQDNVFSGCINLQNIDVSTGNTAFKDDNGVLYTKDGTKIIKYPEGKTNTTYTILNGVTTIGRTAFDGCENLTSIVIPSSVTSMEQYAISTCPNLTTVQIPQNVTNIEEGVFSNCIKLENIDVVEENGKYKDDNGVLYTKDGTKLIKYPEGKTSTSYTILDGTISLERDALLNSGYLTTINIPDSVISIGEGAFEGCIKLANIEVVPDNIAYMDDNGVLYTKTKSQIVEYPAGKENTSYTILDNVINIKDRAFSNCGNLTSIEIPRSVMSIVDSSLNYNPNIKILCYEGSYAEKYAKENEIPYQIIYISSSDFIIDEEKQVIKGIKAETKLEVIKTSLQSEATCEILDQDGNLINDMTKIAATGYQIKLSTGRVYSIVVTGDVNGDGKVKLSDLSKIKLYLVESTELNGAYKEAADLNGDEKVKLSDLSKMKLYLVGKSQL